MNILVTGGAGFIGSNLADRLLLDGHNVIIVDNFNDYYDVKLKFKNVYYNISDNKYKLYVSDIENKNDLEKVFKENLIDCVVHLAGKAGVRPSIEKPESYVKTNILGTVNLLELMKLYKVKKLVFASSSSVYGNSQENLFSEDLNVCNPISQYAATKSSSEQFIYTYTQLYGIKAVCLRFFTVYGPRQRPDLAINKFITLIMQDRPIQMFGDGSTKRDYTFIDDIVAGIVSAIVYEKTDYEIINLGGGEPITLKSMIMTIEKILDKKAIIEQLPMQAGDVYKTVCDWSKAHRLLSYTPSVTFEEGIKKFIDWKYKQN